MAILVSPTTRILIQGITGDFGSRHARLSLDYGTQLVAGVTPGKGGQIFEHGSHRVPIFDTVAEAARETGATVSTIFVPPPFAADAILGAIGEADIGHHFPNTDPACKGMDSLEIVRRAVELVQQQGGRLINIDSTLVAEAPKIAPHLTAMKANLARVLALPEKRIGIKATTNERMGFLGRKEGVAAMAVASVEMPE